MAKLVSSTVENLDHGIFMKNLTKSIIETEEGKEVNMTTPSPNGLAKS